MNTLKEHQRRLHIANEWRIWRREDPKAARLAWRILSQHGLARSTR